MADRTKPQSWRSVMFLIDSYTMALDRAVRAGNYTAANALRFRLASLTHPDTADARQLHLPLPTIASDALVTVH